MDKNKVIEKLVPIFKDVFEDKNLKISKDSNSSNISGWDSLNHILLVVAIEKEFELKFTAEDIQNWEDVGAMVDYISKHV
tara:strand:+ start:119 stop:358 length:240 start_codon:yes stop_codon:yes gene_type:complete